MTRTDDNWQKHFALLVATIVVLVRTDFFSVSGLLRIFARTPSQDFDVADHLCGNLAESGYSS